MPKPCPQFALASISGRKRAQNGCYEYTSGKIRKKITSTPRKMRNKVLLGKAQSGFCGVLLACHLTNNNRPAFRKKSVKDTLSSLLGCSRGQFDCWKPLSRGRSPSFGSSGRASAGFWCRRQRPQRRQQMRKGPSHARRRQFASGKRCLPGQALIHDEGTGQAQLNVRQNHQPGPAIGGLWGAELGRRPLEDLFAEAKGVFDGEPRDIDPPNGRQIRWLWPAPPEPEGHRHFGRSGEVLDLQADEGSADNGTSLARSPLFVVVWDGVQAAPALDPHLPIVRIRCTPLAGRRRPGGRIVTDELAPMPPWTSAGRTRWRVCIETAA